MASDDGLDKSGLTKWYTINVPAHY
jgi:hypothetical protein